MAANGRDDLGVGRCRTGGLAKLLGIEQLRA